MKILSIIIILYISINIIGCSNFEKENEGKRNLWKDLDTECYMLTIRHEICNLRTKANKGCLPQNNVQIPRSCKGTFAEELGQLKIQERYSEIIKNNTWEKDNMYKSLMEFSLASEQFDIISIKAANSISQTDLAESHFYLWGKAELWQKTSTLDYIYHHPDQFKIKINSDIDKVAFTGLMIEKLDKTWEDNNSHELAIDYVKYLNLNSIPTNTIINNIKDNL